MLWALADCYMIWQPDARRNRPSTLPCASARPCCFVMTSLFLSCRKKAENLINAQLLPHVKQAGARPQQWFRVVDSMGRKCFQVEHWRAALHI